LLYRPPYETGMPSRCRNRVSAKSKSGQSRQWRALQIRKTGQMLGYVEARDREAAEQAAVSEFGLTAEQRKRLVVQKRG
jgi:hypothetical protein